MKKLLIILCFLPGCASLITDQIPITVSCEDCREGLVSEAVQEWNGALGMEVFQEVEGIGSIEIKTVPYQRPRGRAQLFGDYCLVTMDENAQKWPLLAHEMGHCTLLEHEDDPDSIMHEDVGDYFSDYTLEEARRNLGF